VRVLSYAEKNASVPKHPPSVKGGYLVGVVRGAVWWFT